MNDARAHDDESHLTPEQAHGRRVFNATMRSARALIAQGVPPGAIVSGLLGVASVIGTAVVGPREMRRVLMTAADANASHDNGQPDD